MAKPLYDFDKKLADDVAGALDGLQHAIAMASKAGLSVEVDTQIIHDADGPNSPLIQIKVARPLV